MIKSNLQVLLVPNYRVFQATLIYVYGSLLANLLGSWDVPNDAGIVISQKSSGAKNFWSKSAR